MAAEPRDPLVDVLALLRPEAVLAAEVHARGRWNLAFARNPAVKFGVVVEGECLLAVEGRAPKKLRAGDVFLLGGSPPFMVASDLKVPGRDATGLLNTRARVVNVGPARATPVTRIVGGHFVLNAANAHLLAGALPPFVRIPTGAPSPLRTLTPLLVAEVRASALGRQRALEHLAQLVLTYALRAFEAEGKAGWLRALADAQIGAAIRHIHGHVEKGVSLAKLARVAGMSRTAFALRFKQLVGQPPLAYAIKWRMSLAKDALRTTDRPIGALAFELGYQSESAFSMAFRREVGRSPRAYRASSA